MVTTEVVRAKRKEFELFMMSSWRRLEISITPSHHPAWRSFLTAHKSLPSSATLVPL